MKTKNLLVYISVLLLLPGTVCVAGNLNAQFNGDFEDGVDGWSGIDLYYERVNPDPPDIINYILGDITVGGNPGGVISKGITTYECWQLTSISFSVFPNGIDGVDVTIETPNLVSLTVPVLSDVSGTSEWITKTVVLSDYVTDVNLLNVGLSDSITIRIKGLSGGEYDPSIPFEGFLLDNISVNAGEIACPPTPGGETTPSYTPSPTFTPTPTITGTISPTPTGTPETTGTPESTQTEEPTPTPTGFPKSLQVWSVPAVLEVDKEGVDNGQYVAYIYMEVRDNYGKLHNLNDDEEITLEKLSGPGILDTRNILPIANRKGRYSSTYSPAFEDGRAQIVAKVEFKNEDGETKYTKGTTTVLVRTILSSSELENLIGERPVAKKTLYFRGLR